MLISIGTFNAYLFVKFGLKLCTFLGSSFHAMASSVILYSHTHGKMKYVFSSNKIFEVFPDHLHSYLNVYLRYLAFAFETLHYPWIPSYGLLWEYVHLEHIYRLDAKYTVVVFLEMSMYMYSIFGLN